MQLLPPGTWSPPAKHTGGQDQKVEWQSQVAQDHWVMEYVFGYRRDGYFVDVGAHDGKSFSNTFVLETNFGWKGICVEPMENEFEKLVKNRPASVHVPVCAYDRDFQIVNFALQPITSNSSDRMLSGISEDLRSEIANRPDWKVIPKPTMTLSSIFKLYNAPTHMDYLSIDTEGSELKVLKGIDWSVYSFAIITVEHAFQEPSRSEIQQLLLSKGYRYIGELRFDDVYSHSSTKFVKSFTGLRRRKDPQKQRIKEIQKIQIPKDGEKVLNGEK